MRNLLVTAPIISVAAAGGLYVLSVPLWIVIFAALFSAPLVVLIALVVESFRDAGGRGGCKEEDRGKDDESSRK